MRKEQKHLSIGINCTVVELKLQMSLVHYLMRLSINCTVVELKLRIQINITHKT